MKRHDYGLYAYTLGIILLVIQFLVIVFKALNGTLHADDGVFVYVENVNFLDVISKIWGSLLGTLLLIVLYVRRFIKGHEAMLVLVGALLWVIQLFNLYEPSYDLRQFLIKYILGIAGIVFIVITGFYDAYYIKRMDHSDSDD